MCFFDLFLESFTLLKISILKLSNAIFAAHLCAKRVEWQSYAAILTEMNIYSFVKRFKFVTHIITPRYPLMLLS